MLSFNALKIGRKHLGAVVTLVIILAAAPVTRAQDWDGESWADLSRFVSPITPAVRQNLLNARATGDAAGRVEGRMGQLGDSITYSSAYFRNAVMGGADDNETGHDYTSIRSWLSYSGTQPADFNSFYRDHGKSAAYGNQTGWDLIDAILAGEPTDSVVLGDGITPGNFSWALTMFGTNDIDKFLWDPSTFESDYRSYVQQLITLGVIPVLSTIPPEQVHAGDGLVEEANARIRTVAETLNVPLVDFYALVLHRQPLQWLGTLISSDGTHPSAGGGGDDFSRSGLTISDGYAARTQLTFEVAERIRAIVFQAAPAEPPRLGRDLSVHRDALTWVPQPFDESFDVVSGDLNSLRAADGDFATATLGCLAAVVVPGVLAESMQPFAGEGFWFLLRGRTVSGPGSYDLMGQGTARDDGTALNGGACP